MTSRSKTLRQRKNSEISLDDNDSNSSSGIMTRSHLKRLSLSQSKLVGSPRKQAKDSTETTVPTSTRQTPSRSRQKTPTSQDSLDTEPRAQKRSRVVRAIIPAPSEPDSDADAPVPAASRKCRLVLSKVSESPDEDVKSPKRPTRASELVKTEASTSNSNRKSSKNVKNLKRIVEEESSSEMSDASIEPAIVTRRSSRKVDRSSVLQTPSSVKTRNTSNESDKSPPKNTRRSSRLVLPPSKERSKPTELESPTLTLKLTKLQNKSPLKTKESPKPIEDKDIDTEESVRVRSADFSEVKPIRTSVVGSFSVEEDEDSNDVRVNVDKIKKISNKQLLDDNENDDLSKIEVKTSRKKSPKVNLIGSPKSVQNHTSDKDKFEHEHSEKVAKIQGTEEKQKDLMQKPRSKPLEPVSSDEEEQHVEDGMKDVDLSDTLEREAISKHKSPKSTKKSPVRTKRVPDQEKLECVGDDDNRLSEAGDGDQHLNQKLTNISPEKSSKSRKLHKKVQQDEGSDESSLSVESKHKCFEKDEFINCVSSSDHMSSSIPLVNTKSRKLVCSKNKRIEDNEYQVTPVKHREVEQHLDTVQIQLDSSDFSSAQSVIVSRLSSVSESVGQSVNMKVHSDDRNQMIEEIEVVCVKSSDDSDLNIVGEYVLASKTHDISTKFNENSERSIEKKKNLAIGTEQSTFGFGESNKTLHSQNSDTELMYEKTSMLARTQNSDIGNLMNKSNSMKNKVNISKKSNVDHKIKAEVSSLSKSSPYTSIKQDMKVESIQDSDSDAESRKAIMISAQKRIEQSLSTSESDSKHLLRAVHKSLGADRRDDSSDSDSAPDNVTFEAGRKGVMESLRNAVESIQKEKQRKKDRRRERLEKLKLLKEEKLIRLKERLASQEDASCSSSEESGYEEETLDASGKRNKHKMVAKSKSLRIEKENMKEDSKLNKKKPNISEVESDGSGDQKMPASGGLKRLPAEVLDQLPDQIPAKLQKLALQDERSKKKKKERTEVKIEQEKDLSGFKAPSNLDYIPLKSSGATQFGVVALEKAAKAPKSIAQQAADFRQNMLYGSRLVREPAKNNVIYQQKRKAFSKDRFVR